MACRNNIVRSAQRLIAVALCVSVCSTVVHGEETDCQKLCTEVREELKSGIACRDYRRMLPRPKVGLACTYGFNEAVTDACFATCSGEKATNVVSQACREYKAEMPKPVMYKSCETGYNSAFRETQNAVKEKKQGQSTASEETKASKGATTKRQQKQKGTKPALAKEERTKKGKKAAKAVETNTPERAPAQSVEDDGAVKDKATAAEPKTAEPEHVESSDNNSKLRGDASQERKEQSNAPEEQDIQEKEKEEEEETEPEQSPSGEEDEVSFLGSPIVAKLPVTVDDHEVDLEIHEGESARHAVASFCEKHMPTAGAACKEQLLPHVSQKLEENGIGA